MKKPPERIALGGRTWKDCGILLLWFAVDGTRGRIPVSVVGESVGLSVGQVHEDAGHGEPHQVTVQDADDLAA